MKDWSLWWPVIDVTFTTYLTNLKYQGSQSQCRNSAEHLRQLPELTPRNTRPSISISGALAATHEHDNAAPTNTSK